MPAAAEGGAARTRCVSQPDSAMPRAPAPEKMGRRQAPRDARARRPREFIIVSRPCLIVRCTVSSVRCVCSQVIHSHITRRHTTGPCTNTSARSLDRKRTGNGNGKAERHDPRRAATGADDKASLPGSPAQQPAQHARLDARRLASPREYSPRAGATPGSRPPHGHAVQVPTRALATHTNTPLAQHSALRTQTHAPQAPSIQEKSRGTARPHTRHYTVHTRPHCEHERAPTPSRAHLIGPSRRAATPRSSRLHHAHPCSHPCP